MWWLVKAQSFEERDKRQAFRSDWKTFKIKLKIKLIVLYVRTHSREGKEGGILGE